MRRFLTSRPVRSIFSLLLLGAFAYTLWPTTAGGAATFVVVRGHSMEPTYQQGDLLYARNDRSFRPGDVAVYRIPNGKPGAGALVVHRIQRRLPDGSYLFQGDNKNSPDDVTPAAKDLVATPMVDLGRWPTKALIMAPLLFTIVVGIAVTVALWPARHRDDETGDDDHDDEHTDDHIVEQRDDEPAVVLEVRTPAGTRGRSKVLLVHGTGVGRRAMAPVAADEPFYAEFIRAECFAPTAEFGHQRVGE